MTNFLNLSNNDSKYYKIWSRYEKSGITDLKIVRVWTRST